MATCNPTVADVGALLRARTKTSAGDYLGTFTALTKPTDTEVQAIILQAVSRIVGKIGDPVPVVSGFDASDIEGKAKFCAILLSAMLVELSYFPEEVRQEQSAYKEYKLLFDEAWAEFLGLIPGAVLEEGVVIPGNADWYFEEVPFLWW